jgi:hypothetical protein
VVVAVVLVRVVQATIDEVVGVIVVRDGLVPALGAVDMAAGIVVDSVGVPMWMLAVNCDGVLVDVVVVRMVEVPVVEVVDVPFVSHGGVPTAGTVLVVVLLVHRVVGHVRDRTWSNAERQSKCEREALSWMTLRTPLAGCTISTRLRVDRPGGRCATHPSKLGKANLRKSLTIML